MDFMDEFENDDELDDALKKYLRFEIETFKKTKYEINKENFKLYVACCKIMQKIAEQFGGEVKEDYEKQMQGKSFLFNMNIKSADCLIVVPDLALCGETFELFKEILNYSSNLGITPMNDGRVSIGITIPNVYIDKGIEF